jgi:hypothetical protein
MGDFSLRCPKNDQKQGQCPTFAPFLEKCEKNKRTPSNKFLVVDLDCEKRFQEEGGKLQSTIKEL